MVELLWNSIIFLLLKISSVNIQLHLKGPRRWPCCSAVGFTAEKVCQTQWCHGSNKSYTCNIVIKLGC